MADPVQFTVMQHAQMIPEQRRGEFQVLYLSQRKDRGTALVLSLLLGSFGVDRFYVGNTGAGVFKLLTLGLCGVWTVIDWFVIMSAADGHNREILQRLTLMYPAQAPQFGQGYGPPPGFALPPTY